MKFIFKNTPILTMTHLLKILLLGLILSPLSCALIEKDSAASLTIDPALKQTVFSTPEEAANVFVLAVENKNTANLNAILGENHTTVLPIDNLSDEDIVHFLSAWKSQHKLIAQGQDKKMIQVGKGGWTFPIPIVSGSTGWYFDIAEGLERMRIRRIGRNELNVMQAVLAYYDAQMEYFETDHNADGILEYAQKFISSPEKHDGLYWQAQAGDSLSPLGPLFADREIQQGYHGYFYKILNAQGDDAQGNATTYLVDGKMTKGFALIAWPEEYAETGIMTFIVSHSGIIYEQNLGAQTSLEVEKITHYNPNSDWIPSKETY